MKRLLTILLAIVLISAACSDSTEGNLQEQPPAISPIGTPPPLASPAVGQLLSALDLDAIEEFCDAEPARELVSVFFETNFANPDAVEEAFLAGIALTRLRADLADVEIRADLELVVDATMQLVDEFGEGGWDATLVSSSLGRLFDDPNFFAADERADAWTEQLCG